MPLIVSCQVVAGKTLQTSGRLLKVTSNDIELSGYLFAGTVEFSVNEFRNIAVGVPAANVPELRVDTNELQRINTTAGAVFGSAQSGSMAVALVSEINSRAIEGVVTLVAAKNDETIQFTTLPSTFSAIAAQVLFTALPI